MSPRSSLAVRRRRNLGLLTALLAVGLAQGQGGSLRERFRQARGGGMIQLFGRQKHATLERSGGPGGFAAPIVIAGPATLTMNKSGGSDTLSFKNSGPVHLHNLTLEPDDRAAVMFPNGRRHVGIHFLGCKIGLASGKGWNAETNQGFRGKWGVLSYELDDFLFQGGEVVGIAKEHCFYHHNPRARLAQGNAIVLRGVTMKWAGRTAVQVVCRSHEGPGGQGNVIIDGCTIEDVCLEDDGGGSALTFRGNLNGKVLIRNTTVKLGANPRLHPRLRGNITGALVMDIGSGAGQRGTKELTIEGCHFQVGPAYVGKGAARRPNVNVSHVEKLIIKGTKIINHKGAAEALALDLRHIRELRLDRKNEVRGTCILEPLGTFPDPEYDGSGYRAMLAEIERRQRAASKTDAPRLVKRIHLF